MTDGDDQRAQIAERLRDGLADRLAALATRLDAVMVRAASPDVQRVLGQAAAELTELTRGVRAMIVDLQRGDDDPAGVVGRVRGFALAAGQSLGCTPRVVIDGPLESLEAGLAADVARVVEEALANVVRHSYAGTIEVSVTLGDGALTVEVRDDGVGPRDDRYASEGPGPGPDGVGSGGAGGGLAGLWASAMARGGSLLVEPNEPLGTRLRWAVPAGPVNPR